MLCLCVIGRIQVSVVSLVGFSVIGRIEVSVVLR